jgi:hypothetical protein
MWSGFSRMGTDEMRHVTKRQDGYIYKMRYSWMLVLVLFTNVLRAGKYDFLERFEIPISAPVEASPPHEDILPISLPMSAFYSALGADKKITFYLGFGKDAFHGRRLSELYEMLREISKIFSLGFDHWYIDTDSNVLGFQNPSTGIAYAVTLGHERNEFGDAFKAHDIVMYHGHSRYGRGPAFDSYSHYFRMGDVFPTIEVDVRNSYFLDEEILQADTYPPIPVTIENEDYLYQYRGQKNESSHLTTDAYTKIIRGMDVDLKATPFQAGKQLLWFYSCSNELYWKKSIRKKFPDPKHKLVFGTNNTSYWSARPAAVFITSIAREIATSGEIIGELNAVKDCADCFTSY